MQNPADEKDFIYPYNGNIFHGWLTLYKTRINNHHNSFIQTSKTGETPFNHSAYTVHYPSNNTVAPIILESPHSSENYHLIDDLNPKIKPYLYTMCDRFVDQLWSKAPEFGAILQTANFPRYLIDLNRSLDDIALWSGLEEWPYGQKKNLSTELQGGYSNPELRLVGG